MKLSQITKEFDASTVGTGAQPSFTATPGQATIGVDPQAAKKAQALAVKQMQDRKKQIQDQINQKQKELMDLKKELAAIR